MSKGFISKLFGGGEDTSREKTFVRRDDLFRSAFEQAPVGIAFAGTDGQWLQFNDRFLKMLGFPREEMLRTSIRELTHAEDRKIEAPHVRRLTTGEIESYTIDKRLLLRNGKYGTFRVSVSRCSKASGDLEYYEYIVAPADTTAPREGTGSGWLERVIEQIEDFAVVRTTQEGTISGWSHGAEKIFGYKASEVLTKPRSMLYRDADAFERKHEEELRNAMKVGLYNAESWRVGKDGFAIWTHITLVTVKQEDGRVEVVEIVRQPSHLRSNPAHEAFRKRSEELLTEAKVAHDALLRRFDEAKETHQRELAAVRADTIRLSAELKKREGVERTLRDSFAELSQGSEETYRELKIMAEALKKEMERRRELEVLLADARSEMNAASTQWQEELDRFIAQQEREAAAQAARPQAPALAVAFEEINHASFITRFMALENEAATGTIVCRRGSVEIRVHLCDGAVIACTSNQGGMPLGEMLVDRGIITDGDRNRALEIQSHTNIAFGRVLLLLNALSQEELVEMMNERTRLELAQLFGWDELSFAFTTEETPAAKIVPLRLSPASLVAWLDPSGAEAAIAGEDTLVDSRFDETVSAREQNEPLEEAAAIAATAPATEPQQLQPSETPQMPVVEDAAFVGNDSKRGRKVHRPECRSVAKIPSKSRVEFASLEVAKEEGFEPCSLCLKEPKPKKAAAPRKEKAPKKPRAAKKKSAAEIPAADVN